MSTRTILQCALILSSIFLNSLAQTTLPRATFGELCGSNGTRCDSRSFLTCLENKCECIKPKEMTFDKSKEKCLVLSGERCSYTAVENLREKKWTEKLDCVDNAKCSNEGYCSCLPEYYEDSQRFCVPKNVYGQNCSNIQNCREDKYLMCIDGVCRCNNTDAIFDSERNECVIKAGRPCSDNTPCIKSAFCADSWSDPRGNCTCLDDYKISKTGLCLAQYNMECNSKTVPCTDHLACINGQCSCQYPGHQIYKDDGSNKCVSLLRGPCMENINGNILSFNCISGAECQTDNITGIHECRCSKGYIESDNRTCGIEYGQTCETTKGKNPCGTIANLICKNGICTCPDFQVYNSVTSKCQGLDGEKCKLETAEVDGFCINGSYCRSYRDDKYGEGVCRCLSSEFVADSDRKCVLRVPSSKSTGSSNIAVSIKPLNKS